MRALFVALLAHACDHTCVLDDSCGVEVDVELPARDSLPRRLSTVGGPPAEITIAVINRNKQVLEEAALLELALETVNADTSMLPNTILKGVSLSEGSTDKAFHAAVDYAHKTAGACVTLGITSAAKQELTGSIIAQRNTNHGFYVDTTLSTGKKGADFGTTFGLLGYAQMVPRFLDMAAGYGVRRFGLLFPTARQGIAKVFTFAQQSRDLAIAYEKIYEPSSFNDMTSPEINGFATMVIDGIVASKATVFFMCFCGTKNVEFRIRIMRLANEAGIFGPGYQWYTHYRSLLFYMEPLVQMPEYEDLLPMFDHFKIMDIAMFEPDEYGVGSPVDTAAFETSLAEHIARHDPDVPSRGYDALAWLNCSDTGADSTICDGTPKPPGTRLLQYDILLHVVQTLHKIIYDGGDTTFCDVSERGYRTGDPAKFMTLLEASPSRGLSGHQQFERVQLIGGTALSLSRTWVANDWTAVDNHNNGVTYAEYSVSDMFSHRSLVVDETIGSKAIIYKDFKTQQVVVAKDIKWQGGVVGTVPKDWYSGMCGMSAHVDVDSTEKLCLACPVYHFNPLDDAEECVKITTYVCPAGTVMDAARIGAGVDPCVPCGKGFFSPGGSYEDVKECKACLFGSYSGRHAHECTKCSATLTTLVTAATQATQCTCEEGSYWNARDDVCMPCPSKAFCPGGLHHPVTYASSYGLVLGSVVAYKQAADAKLAGTYDKASFGDAAYKFEVYKCGSVVHCPAEEVITPFDLSDYSVAAVKPDLPTRAGAPLDNSCPDRREGIACFRCVEGYFGSKECQECQGGSTAVNVVIFVIFPFLMLFLYKGTTSQGTARVQTAFILVSTCGMASFFMQTIAVMDSFSMKWPAELSWLFSISKIFMFDLSALSLSCLHGNSFVGKFWAGVLIPMFLFVFVAIAMAMSRVLPEDYLMKMNHTCSMVGMILSALYVTLVKVVVAWFECPTNPAAPPTLSKYKDVVCYSDHHNEALPAVVIGLTLYVAGLYLLFVHAAYVAPHKWMNVDFRERWKFMLARWRPDVWFWGSVMMTRNLLVAIAGLVAADSRVQLVYAAFIIIVTITLTAVWQPWRAPILNHYDVASCIVLVLIAMFGLIFLSLEEEVDLNERLAQWTVVDQKRDLLSLFATWLSAAIGVFGAMFAGIVIWAVSGMIPSRAAKQMKEHDVVCSALLELVNKCVAREDFAQESSRLVFESTAFDRAGVKNFFVKLSSDKRSIQGGTTDTRSIELARASKHDDDVKIAALG